MLPVRRRAECVPSACRCDAGAATDQDSRPSSIRSVLDVQLFLSRLTLALVALVAAVDHGFSQDRLLKSPSAIPLAQTPHLVTRFCSERAARSAFPVLCPTRYPRVASSQVTPSGRSLLGPSFYWASFNDVSGFSHEDDGHLIFGGQRLSFSLAGTPGQTWPRPGQARPVAQLGLPRWITTPTQGGGRYVAQRPARILRHATVRASVALVLVAPAYPDGGFMGGHVIVLWNRQHHGYMLSFHFANARDGTAYTLAKRVVAALDIARSCAPR